ncbi:Type III-A CRISPR-associated protein Csm2 [Hyella patelloides LEGE 07179]|uniref:CRISPR system Cms protein Csm2 n=1 Tax=Hyella patelloides LEGE 07179 TaxID=945734 RepID=A0A563W3E1_9CYAN|nr:type III-A CRISPR-associated protein Csm2 [Hyella patelloides]VEP18160.1 Type III-A CRISPR-associated protein Csm2 [Hyella patelloides LEGE 07179]
MNQSLNKPYKKSINTNRNQIKEKKKKIEYSSKKENDNEREMITKEIIKTIEKSKNGLHEYKVRPLVEDTEKFSDHLKKYGLKTNHLRRFLDSLKQLKARLAKTGKIEDIQDDLYFLQPQLAFAAARKKQEMRKGDSLNPAQDFCNVVTAGIKKVHSEKDFYRLVQLVEAIIAYHKAAGGD